MAIQVPHLDRGGGFPDRGVGPSRSACPTPTDSGAGGVLSRSAPRSPEVGNWRRARQNAQTERTHHVHRRRNARE
jgi:hypothetical protein